MKIYSRLLFCILTKDPFFLVCFCLSFSWVKQSSPSYHDLLLGERAPLVHCSSVMLLFPFWDLFLWITMDQGWEHLQWNKPMTGMAEAWDVEIIILMDDSAALSHFLEEIGWGKYGGIKDDLFFSLVFLKLALCVLKMTDRKRLLQEELTFSVTKKKQNRKRRATDQARFSTSLIISFPSELF